MKLLLFLSILFICNSVDAQFSRYIVTLKNKAGTPHTIANPTTYLSNKAIARRTKYNIAIDSTDLPITPRYIDSLKLTPGVTILNVSKWLNQVAILTTNSAAISTINSFTFVQNTSGVASRLTQISNISTNKLKTQLTSSTITNQENSRTQLSYGGSFNQINIHNGQYLHDKGFTGNGMTIAVMDAGFNSYLTNQGVDSLRINNQLKGTWDFVANEASVNEDDSHGFFCLSILAANKPNLMIGSAPKADYYLYRTEDVASEYPIEEQNWIAAAERADSVGVDAFSTSLGYIDFDDASLDYTYPKRNGNTAMMTRAADLAAKKGILVFNAAGNNGNGSGIFTDYKFVAIPADGDSVIAVGSCSAAQLIASSSAWGPAFGGKIKPNITSMGLSTAFFNTSGGVSTGNGTSFACPNIAGLGTALWQAFPEINNMSIADCLQKAGHLTTPNDRFGYGIPNMKKAFVIGLFKVHTATATISNCTATINYTAKDNGIGTYTLERKLATDANFVTMTSINAATTPWALKNYSITDNLNTVALGSVLYRIKHSVGTDTSFYYPSVTVSHNIACATPIIPVNSFNITIAPNPIKGNLYVNLGSLIGTNNTLKIINSNGATIYNNKIIGTTTMQINSKNWAAGLYIVELWQHNKLVFSKKVVKE
jgi:serine protease AprX